VRLDDFRFSLRRFQNVLFTRRRDGMKVDEDRDRAASVGMDDVQKPHRRHATRSSNRRQLHAVFPESGPQDNGRPTGLSRVQSTHESIKLPCGARAIRSS